VGSAILGTDQPSLMLSREVRGGRRAEPTLARCGGGRRPGGRPPPNVICQTWTPAQDCRDGVFSGTNDVVETLTGQKPLGMVDYIVKNKALFS
jgi:hypothetical protein